MFGATIGLISWLFLSAQIFLAAAEINSVSAWRLWPRTLVSSRGGPADERAEADQRFEDLRTPDESASVTFGVSARKRER
jgi:uncharacterized BrkB/YihY/UPF0761 family membrane protein